MNAIKVVKTVAVSLRLLIQWCTCNPSRACLWMLKMFIKKELPIFEHFFSLVKLKKIEHAQYHIAIVLVTIRLLQVRSSFN